MKLISVQSRGAKIVRVSKTAENFYEIYKKLLSFWPDIGFTYNYVGTEFYKDEVSAIKAAEKWLEGARV